MNGPPLGLRKRQCAFGRLESMLTTFGTPKRPIVSSTVAVAPADFETSARDGESCRDRRSVVVVVPGRPSRRRSGDGELPRALFERSQRSRGVGRTRNYRHPLVGASVLRPKASEQRGGQWLAPR